MYREARSQRGHAQTDVYRLFVPHESAKLLPPLLSIAVDRIRRHPNRSAWQTNNTNFWHVHFSIRSRNFVDQFVKLRIGPDHFQVIVDHQLLAIDWIAQELERLRMI